MPEDCRCRSMDQEINEINVIGQPAQAGHVLRHLKAAFCRTFPCFADSFPANSVRVQRVACRRSTRTQIQKIQKPPVIVRGPLPHGTRLCLLPFRILPSTHLLILDTPTLNSSLPGPAHCGRAMSTVTTPGPVEARSLSSITAIASNPPAYPRNPTHEKHDPLVLYIVRVPGSQGTSQFLFIFECELWLSCLSLSHLMSS